MRLGSARWRVAPLLLLAGLLAACGGSGTPAAPVDVTGLSPEERQLLFELNARFNHGRTFRWGTLPIVVFLNGLGRPDEVTRWTAATSGRVSFRFVDSQPQRGISFRLARLDPIVCAQSSEFGPGDEIESAEVEMNPDNLGDPACANVVTHETGHAIGILDHTHDGGLMDPTGGNGQITEAVARMVINLYSFPPGTPITLNMQARSGQRRGVAVRFVYYKR